MLQAIKDFFKTLYGKFITVIAVLVLLGWVFMEFIYPPFFESYTGVLNAQLTFESSRLLTEEEAYEVADSLWGIEPDDVTFSHIEYFLDEGIFQYKGPETCMQCHPTMELEHPDGTTYEVDMLEDVVNTIHFRFQSTAGGFTTYGYDGRKVNEDGRPIPVGKIDRACGIPGSFSWTGWAELVKTYPHGSEEAVLRSEGCGQCHIGGNYHPATEKMMPIGDVPDETKQGIDCLICHAQAYDMNYKYVIQDSIGRRWNQDRTLAAAMSVTNPTNQNCLNCHQHNMGGDTYVNNVAAKSLGYENQRILHPGAKRANPFSEEHDVHYAAGLTCLDCHQPEGHRIPRGRKGTDLVANDLPDKEVSCEMCHTSYPHQEDNLTRALLNGHSKRLACETCHITELRDVNVVLRDWTNTHWNEEEGLWEYTDVLQSNEPGIGYTFLWFNGNGTFLANAIGDNPEGTADYNPLMNTITGLDKEQVIEEVREVIEHKLANKDIDIEEYAEEFLNTLSQMTPEMIERRKKMLDENIKPLQKQGESRIYPFKLFNARMYEDMSNEGPFGAMILPFDYSVYYETGKPEEAVKEALKNPIVKRMYEYPFKAYMMDEFMNYFGVDEWSGEYPLTDEGELRNVEPNWMRQYGTLMVNHGIQKEGRTCTDCHSENGIMNFEQLGYSKERVKQLRTIPEAEVFN